MLHTENSLALIRPYRGVRGISKGKNGELTIRKSIYGYTIHHSPEEAIYHDIQCITQYKVTSEQYCPNIEIAISEDEKREYA